MLHINKQLAGWSFRRARLHSPGRCMATKNQFRFKLTSAVAPMPCIDPIENDRLRSSEGDELVFLYKINLWNNVDLRPADATQRVQALLRYCHMTHIHTYACGHLTYTYIHTNIHKNCMPSFVRLYICCTMWSCEAFKWRQQPQVRIELKINWKLVKNP